MGRRRGVTRRREGVITRTRASTRGTVDFSKRRIWAQSRPGRVTSRRPSVQIRRLWVDRRRLRVQSVKHGVLRRALVPLGGDGEVIASRLVVQRVPISVDVVAEMIASGSEMTPRRRLMIARGRLATPSRREMTPRRRLVTPRGRLVIPSRREMTPRRALVTPCGRLVVPSRRAMTPRGRLEMARGRLVSLSRRETTPRGPLAARPGREIAAALRLAGLQRRVRTG
jgi:hypothetical protein